MFKTIWSLILFVIITTTTVSPVYAVTIPSFPSCASPQGSTKVSYSSGTHGIVGSTGTYTGTDAVYTLSDDTLTQCFCSSSGEGIQTNWWRASTLSDDDISILKSLGWVYVPAGQLWGLANAPYVALNSNYACLPGSDGIGGGDVLGEESGEILGLAATGDIALVYLSFALGTLFIYIGYRRLRNIG